MLKQAISNTRFFSLLVVGSADVAIIDNELILTVWCDVNRNDEKIHTHMDTRL